MQSFVALIRRVRERPSSDSASAPSTAGTSELREKGRGGLHSVAARGDLARLQGIWWWKRFRINSRDANKQTPLHLACANGHADVVRFLAGKKCKLNPRGMFKKTPLMLAVQHQHKDCVTALLEHGADPDHKGAGGNTALHMAAIMPSKEMVELLLEHNAQIDARNDLGYTPLAVAIIERREEMVEFLLQNGANVNARDIQQRTPLKIAGYAGNTNIVQLLLQHGAVLSHRDRNGFTDMGFLDDFTPDFSKTLQEYGRRKRTGECSAGGAAVCESSSSGTTAESSSSETSSVSSSSGTTAESSSSETTSESSSSETTAAPPVGAPAQTGAGVLPGAGAEQEEDFDSLSDFETDSEGPAELLDAVLLPGAKQQGACAHPGAEERHNGVLPAAGAEEEDDDESTFDSETDSEGPMELSDALLLPAAKQQGPCAHPGAEERHNGVLPAAGAEEEDDDESTFDSETDSEGLTELLDAMLLPATKQQGACAHPGAEERHNGVLPAAGAAQEEEDFDFSSLDEDFALEREELPLKKEASTQTNGQGDTQEWVSWLQQELASALGKCSLAEASLEAEKRYSRDLQEHKLRLQKELDSSKAQLQELQERLVRTECYAESLESAVKNKERELTASKNLQRLLVRSSGTAAVPQLEEHMQQLQVGMARLAVTAQQQAKTMEALPQNLQASAAPLLSLRRH